MVNCSKCGSKIGILGEKHEFKDGEIYCLECYSYWKGERQETALREGLREKEKKLKSALSKNCKWEYEVIQIPTARSGFVATSTKINPQEQLNKLGEEGWELVSAIGMQSISASLSVSSPGTTTSVLFIFKRKV